MKKPGILLNHQNPALAVIFSPDCRYLISSGTGSAVRVWSVGDWKQVNVIESQKEGVHCLAYYKKSNVLAGGCSDGAILRHGPCRMEKHYGLSADMQTK